MSKELIESLKDADETHKLITPLFGKAADALEQQQAQLDAAEKLIEQIIPALENGMIYQQDTKGYYGLYDQTRQALAAAKSWKEEG